MNNLPQTLFQVQVMNKGKPLFIGPAMSNPESLYKLVERINKSVIAGNEKDWVDAHVVQISTLRN